MAKSLGVFDLELPATTVCKIVGIPRWKYQDWEQAGFLSRIGPRCVEADAVEAAIVYLLAIQVEDDEDLLGIIESVRTEARARLTSESTQLERVRLVCDLRAGRGVLVYGEDDAAVGRAVTAGGRSLVIDMSSKVSQVRRDFRHRAGLPKPIKKAGA